MCSFVCLSSVHDQKYLYGIYLQTGYFSDSEYRLDVNMGPEGSYFEFSNTFPNNKLRTTEKISTGIENGLVLIS